MLNLFRKQPSWAPFLRRHPPEWGAALARLVAHGSVGPYPGDLQTDIALREALTLAAVTEVAGPEAADFIASFRHYNPDMFLSENRGRFPVLDRIDALSPSGRTAFFVNVLGGMKLLALTSARSLDRKPETWTRDFIAFRDDVPDLRYLHFDVTSYPIFLNEGAHGTFSGTAIAYALAEVAKAPMDVPEDLAIEFLRIVRARGARHLFFAKGLAKHLVAPYRAEPSEEYLRQFGLTHAFLNEKAHGFGRQNAWADSRHYLRTLMNRAVSRSA
ncbi:hypothetical protein [Sagittula sp. S175]|uniref:hypothetical protein n=1 Tax=Sagittula sp. S175 TaxID=3415129 RepID=UPI003C79EE57